MSYAIDVNLLVYASDRRSRFYRAARSFLEQAMAGTEIVCFPWSTLLGYLRIVTHPAILDRPLDLEEAQENVGAIVSRPQVRILSEPEEFWSAYLQVAERVKPRGNLVPDAHLAVLLKLYQVGTLYTVDADFRKFDFLRVINPLS